MNKERIRILSVYILIMLIIIRFVVVPLNNSVKEKKNILSDYAEAYRAKALILKKQRHGQQEKEGIVDAEKKLLDSVYQKDSPYASIQSEVIQEITGIAEKYGLVVINFELPEVTVTKDISEVPVLIRLKGGLKPVIDMLKDMEKWKKTCSFKNFELVKSEQEFALTMAVSAFRIER